MHQYTVFTSWFSLCEWLSGNQTIWLTFFQYRWTDQLEILLVRWEWSKFWNSWKWKTAVWIEINMIFWHLEQAIKAPMGKKQKNPERTFKLRSMFLIVWPSTVGRKLRKCHHVWRVCHRILPNDKSSPHEEFKIDCI